MALTFKIAGDEDFETAVRTRVIVLRAANLLPEDADMSAVEGQTRAYYQKALTDGSHLTVLARDGDDVVGAGAVCFYEIMPTCSNPSGQCAYIMNMYTAPAYRRRGIAAKTLELLITECHKRGVRHIGLDATAMGKPLYIKRGFGFLPDEMLLNE